MSYQDCCFCFSHCLSWFSSSTFKILDKIMSKFIWQNKKARIKYKTLLCPKERGGLNLPNLKNYYWAAQFKAIIMWIIKETDAVWVGMEQSSCQHAPLESLPFLNETTWKKLKIGNDWIRVTMKIWSLVRKKFKLSSSICRATKITRNPDFLPSMMDAGYNKWTNTGLIFIAQVFDGQTMK